MQNTSILEKRYGVSIQKNIQNISIWLALAAELHTSGDTRRMAQRVIDDFRKTLLGNISLELPK